MTVGPPGGWRRRSCRRRTASSIQSVACILHHRLQQLTTSPLKVAQRCTTSKMDACLVFGSNLVLELMSETCSVIWSRHDIFFVSSFRDVKDGVSWFDQSCREALSLIVKRCLDVRCRVSLLGCQLSGVSCRVSVVGCQWSGVSCRVSVRVITGTHRNDRDGLL